ncbi:hypothetical protein [Niveispirillum sp.]|uniref:hypothetical protein n=1 Tax=Niveispirillum sp. TaxID=1917217 RepID=UPI001B724EBC|nr:hypothetical protein [Niveispirillum sp.]MBP7336312.1 hypothetical protein [Niveispirillum sp.]
MDTNLILLIGPTFFALAALFAPQRQIRRLEDRMRAGDDRYLDEQRSYRAYPWQRNARVLRGLALIVLSLEAVYLGFYLLNP